MNALHQRRISDQRVAKYRKLIQCAAMSGQLDSQRRISFVIFETRERPAAMSRGISRITRRQQFVGARKISAGHAHQNVQVTLGNRSGNGGAADVLNIRARQQAGEVATVPPERGLCLATHPARGGESNTGHTNSTRTHRIRSAQFAALDEEIHPAQ